MGTHLSTTRGGLISASQHRQPSVSAAALLFFVVVVVVAVDGWTGAAVLQLLACSLECSGTYRGGGDETVRATGISWHQDATGLVGVRAPGRGPLRRGSFQSHGSDAIGWWYRGPARLEGADSERGG